MVKVAVKWNKRVFADVEVAPNVADFKAKLQELTVRRTNVYLVFFCAFCMAFLYCRSCASGIFRLCETDSTYPQQQSSSSSRESF